MIEICINYQGLDFKREVMEIASAFFREFRIISEVLENTSEYHIQLREEEKQRDFSLKEPSAAQVKASMYRMCSEWSGKALPWGSLTGIRPTKLYQKLLLQEKDPIKVQERLVEEYFLRPEKAEVLAHVHQVEWPFLKNPEQKKIQIYVGIPFCPSRCSYCSFGSVVLDSERRGVKEYLGALETEIGEVGKAMEGQWTVDSIYIGGGTPGVLEPDEMGSLLSTLKSVFSEVSEITFEAGRPETFSRKKLLALKESGVNRISVNPQTMDDELLKEIGRKHTSREILDAFHLARAEGFMNINMDLIFGLPKDTLENFLFSLEEVLKLRPESITVHGLALKKATVYVEQGLRRVEGDGDISERIYRRMISAGYQPYYLYRQKNTYMNLENIGYALPGFECRFNIHSMADDQSCIAFGADAMTKILTEHGVKRLHNPKFIKDYKEKLQDLVLEKKKLLQIHGN